MARKSRQPAVQGEYTLWEVDEHTGLWTPRFTAANTVMYMWGYLAARVLGQQDLRYAVSAAYLEFKNVTNPTDVVTPPTVNRADGLSYFTGLPAGQDYIRVPLNGLPAIDIKPGSESFFTPPQGNRVTFSAVTAGTVGQLGRAFANGSNSKVFGIALVAAPTWLDATQDLIFARGYFPTNQQLLKGVNTQVGVTWRVSFL